jgi:O-antigen ligase
VMASLACVALGALLQLVPLSRETRLAISPATEAVLLDLHLDLGAPRAGAEDGSTPAPIHFPLSIEPDATRRGLVILLGLALLLAGLTRLLAITGARRLCTWLVAFGAALALFAILQFAVLGDDVYDGMRISGFWKPRYVLTTPFGPFVNKNHFAGWMLMGLPLAIGLGLGWTARASRRPASGWRSAVLWLSSPDGGAVQLALIAIALMSVSLVMTLSRSGIAGFVIAIALSALVVSRRFEAGRLRWAVLGSLVLLLVAMSAAAGSDVANRFVTGAGSVELRKQVWIDSLAAIRDFSLVGTGLNTFGTAMVRYQTARFEGFFSEAHNDYLQLATEGGLLLAVPALAGLVLLVVAIRRRFDHQRDDVMTYWLRVGASSGLVAIALQSLVEFSLQMPGNAVFCVVLMAVALHIPPRKSSRPSSEPGSRPRS